MKTLEEIGARVADTRKKLTLSQRTVAEIAGVSLRTITLLENGQASEIGYSRLARILAVLGLELDLRPVSPERPTLDDLLREDAADD
jgi:transcriptional regulator with XRE-family HTH domain